MRRFAPFLAALLAATTVGTAAASAEPLTGLDPNYGVEGVATVLNETVGPDQDPGVLSLMTDVDPLGRVVTLAFGPGGGDLYRLDPEGRPDPSFGVGGRADPETPSGFGEATLEAASSGIVLGGRIGNQFGDDPDSSVPSLVRLRPDGAVDTTWGTGGAVELPREEPNLDTVVALDVAADGGLAAVVGNFGANGPGYTIHRLGPDGTPVAGFGDGGSVHVQGPGGVADGAVAVDALGRVVVGNVQGGPETPWTSEVRRFRPDGSADPTFGAHGVVALGSGIAFDLEVLARDASIVVVGGDVFGAETSDPVVWKLRPDGALDGAFGEEGVFRKVDSPGMHAVSVVELPSGRLAMSAEVPGETVTREVTMLRPDGTLETAFGAGGTIASAYISPWDGLGVGADGQLLVVATGEVEPDGGFFTTVTAYSPDLPSVAPTITSVTAGRGSLSVRWDASEVEVGGPVRVHQLFALDDGVLVGSALVAGDVRQTTITGLPNGHELDVVVLPYTDKGAMLASEPVSGTPTAAAPAAVLSSVARDITVTPGKGFATVTWAPPADDGGSPVSGYGVIALRHDDGSVARWRNVAADVRTASFTGLTAGTSYDFYVLPINGLGFGAVAPLVNAVVVDTTPVAAAPSLPWANATPVGTNAFVAWSAATERGEAVTAYNVVVVKDGVPVSWVQPDSTKRRATVAIPTTGSVDVYVFAKSASGFGPLSGPLPVRD